MLLATVPVVASVEDDMDEVVVEKTIGDDALLIPNVEFSCVISIAITCKTKLATIVPQFT